jgi:hypothetical protein
MERWKNFSRNPLECMKIAYTKHSSIIECLNCGFALKGDFKIRAILLAASTAGVIVPTISN